jgi:hypothetical protein
MSWLIEELKGSNEAIDYQNSKLGQQDEWIKNNV